MTEIITSEDLEFSAIGTVVRGGVPWHVAVKVVHNAPGRWLAAGSSEPLTNSEMSAFLPLYVMTGGEG